MYNQKLDPDSEWEFLVNRNHSNVCLEEDLNELDEIIREDTSGRDRHEWELSHKSGNAQRTLLRFAIAALGALAVASLIICLA